MNIDALNAFSLVGGTALALIYGHRVSVDLDLFSTEEFDNLSIIKSLKNTFKEKFVYENRNPKFGLFCYIDNVKVDIIRYPHKQLQDKVLIDNIRMYDPVDIIAMKVQAILNRAKKKDFWDIAELLKHYTIQDFCDFHKAKFETQNLLISVPSALTYFEDAEEDEDPICLKNQNWETIKNDIKQKVNEYLL